MTKLHLAGVAVALLLPPIPLAAQEIDLVSGQVFSITTKGPSSIPGKPELMLQGVAFAVSDDTLLTSFQAIGSAADFNAREPFKKGGVADRTILLGESNQAVTVRQHSAYPAAVLVNAAGGAKLAPFKLSACSADAGTYSVQINAETSMAVRPTQAGQQVIDFRVLSTTDSTIPKNSLGAPVLRDGQVIGILTDVTPEGKTIGVIPIEEIAAVLPDNIVIDCDPRSLVRIAKLESDLLKLGEYVKYVEYRATPARDTVDMVLRSLADVADDLDNMKIALDRGEDVQPFLKRMSASLQQSTAKPMTKALSETTEAVSGMLTTVSKIEDYLTKPTWQVTAKNVSGALSVTFSYQLKIPDPVLSERLTLCVRAIKPYHSDEAGHHNFLSSSFYVQSIKPSDEKVVKCSSALIANPPKPGDVKDEGKYSFEIVRDELVALLDVYKESEDAKSWFPEDYVWNGLAYAVLIQPADATKQGAKDTEIMRALVRVPDRSSGGLPPPVECREFESRQILIDYLTSKTESIVKTEDGAGDVFDVSSKTLFPVSENGICELVSVP